MRPRLPAPAPASPREEAARRLLERGLAAATVVVLVAGVLEGASRPAPRAVLESLPVDVANDPPWRLSLLPGLGRARAEAVVRDRQANGPVASLDDLDRVPGVGRKTVEALRAQGAVVGPPTPADGRRAGGAPARLAADASRPRGPPGDGGAEGGARR